MIVDIDDPVYVAMATEFGTVEHGAAWARRSADGAAVVAVVAVSEFGRLAAPLLWKENAHGYDVASPFGEAGVFGDGGLAAWKALQSDLANQGVIAAYLRVSAPRVVPLVMPAPPVAWVPPGVGTTRFHASDRRAIRRSAERGWKVGVVERPGPEWWAEFVAVHAETMARHGATEQYGLDSVDREWVDGPWDWYAVEARLNGELGAAGIRIRGEAGPTIGLWSATADRFRKESPYKAVLAATLERELDRGMVLGRATQAGDSLEAFKVRMGAELLPAGEARLVLDPHAFGLLCDGHFPPWRG